jgi:hypothetical protein
MLMEYFNIQDTGSINIKLDTLEMRIYNIDTIVAFEKRREQKQRKLKESCIESFTSDNTLEISLINVNIGFNPTNLIVLDSIGTVYPILRITDDWGILEADSIAALISPDWKLVTLTVPVEITDTIIRGRGWTLKLSKGYELSKNEKKYYVETTNAQQNL